MSASSAPPEICTRLSRAFRECVSSYRLKQQEQWLADRLCLDSLDVGLLRAPLRLPAWSARYPMREDKMIEVLESLRSLEVVDIHEADASYELRTSLDLWSRLRALRVPAATSSAHPELPLSAERPLDEAMTSLSREAALAIEFHAHDHATPQPADHSPSKGVAAATPYRPAEKSAARAADNFAGVAAEKSAGLKFPIDRGFSPPAEKSAALPHDHEEKKNVPIMTHGNIMTHDLSGFWDKKYDVGASSPKSARELMLAIFEVCGSLPFEHQRNWRRRIEEDAVMVWQGVSEVKLRHDVGNKAGWLNRFYLKEKGIVARY